MPRIIRTLILALPFIAMSQMHMAFGAGQELPELPELKVTFILSPPLIIETEQAGTYGGIMVDAVKRLAGHCGFRARFFNSPSWSRAQAAVRSGVMDGLMPTNWSEERLQYYHFPHEPIYKSEMTVMTLKSYGYQAYTGLGMLKGKRIGKLDNALISPDVDAFVAGGNVVLSERSTVLALFENLIRGRLDFVIGDVLSAIHYTGEIGIWEKVQVLDPPIGAIPQYLALSKSSPLFMDGNADALQCLLSSPQNADGDKRGAEVYRKKSK